MNLPLSAVAAAVNGTVVGADVMIQGISTDSRSVRRGDLFIALRGPHFDGHKFLPQVADSAVAAMVDRAASGVLPMVQVGDTRRGLGRLASMWRQHFSIPVAAVTGSNGKTSVKEMLAAILRRRGRVLATEGNLNNDIGVPLTLLRLRSEDDFAVIEMGANHSGEIAYLSDLAKPSLVIITNAAAAHLEGFGSMEDVVRAKGEILDSLSAEGVAVLNFDDPHVDYWLRRVSEQRAITFGLHEGATVSADIDDAASALFSQFQLHIGDEAATVRLPLPGRHNVMNALAAAAAAHAMGCAIADIRAALESLPGVSGRLQCLRNSVGQLIINDSYNANPASAKAAIAVLASHQGPTLLLLGDMGELGADADTLHREIGVAARAAQIDQLFVVGQYAAQVASGFDEKVDADGATDRAHCFADQQSLIVAAQQWLAAAAAQAAVLIKGSRSAGMECVVVALLDADDGHEASTDELNGALDATLSD
ncbi:MAG: UDP-N-acetylmuramoyl-tripeptide--D-alanyl-D-alanine ligase [Gammaproteobacteria bacterium]|nr:UDP-N-acetylmuramoyl-tripeptide--D-alanyl-D-alanine ligase [Gammaproteobacteria bacterium]